MTLIVEDGTGVTGANAYGTMDECAAYAALRGLTFSASPSTEGEAAIIRATAALDGIYRARFSGYRTYARAQSLEWPRSDCYDYEGNLVAGDEIPVEIKQACFEMAVRELAVPNSMRPDLERGGNIQSVSAGSVSVTYGANATATTKFTAIDQIIASLLGVSQSSYAASSSRG